MHDVERLRILEMVRDGKITPEDGARLLDELGRVPRGPSRILRVRILAPGGQQVQFGVPVSIARSVLMMIPDAARRAIEARGIALDEVAGAIEEGNMRGPIVDIRDPSGATVEVVVE